MNELEAFNELKLETANLIKPVLSVSIKTPYDARMATETAQKIREYEKRITAKRMELNEPYRKKVDEINAYAKQILEPITQALNHLKIELNKFAYEQEKIKIAELERLQKERQRQENEMKERHDKELEIAKNASLFFQEEVSETITENQQVEKAIARLDHQASEWDAKQQQIKNVRKNIRVRIVDQTLVPKEYLVITLNDKMAIAAYKGGNKKIPGLEFTEELSVAIGSKTRVPKEML